MEKDTKLKELEESVREFSKNQPTIPCEEIIRITLEKSGFDYKKEKNLFTFNNSQGLISKPLDKCNQLEVYAYRAMEAEEQFPKECLNCRKIFIHPKKDKISYLTVFSGLVKALDDIKDEVPIFGKTIIPSDKEVQHERIVLEVFKHGDMLKLIHQIHYSLQGAKEYGDNYELPLHALNFFKKKGSLIHVRHGCSILRSFAKQLKCFDSYFRDKEGVLYKNVPVDNSESQSSF